MKKAACRPNKIETDEKNDALPARDDFVTAVANNARDSDVGGFQSDPSPIPVSSHPHRGSAREVVGGKTVVLFFHGFLESPRQFDDFVARIPSDIAYRNLLLPGHGGNGSDFAHSGLDKWRSYVQNAIEDAGERYKNIVGIGHSMGALLLLDQAILNPSTFSSLFLLAVPLKMRLSVSGAATGLRVAFSSADDARTRAARFAYGVENKNPFLYPAWLPRFRDLFRFAKTVRKRLCGLSVPTIVYQSERDEYVSRKSERFLKNASVTLRTLPNSGHFLYETGERTAILQAFEDCL